MVSGGVLVIWQGDMLVGLPGGPSPVLRMNFIHPHQSYLVTPMQWVMWAAVKIKIVYVFGAKAQTLTLISYYENWCENGLPQFWSGKISFFQFTYHNGRFRGRKKPIFRQTQISYQVGETYIYIYISRFYCWFYHIHLKKSISRISIMINICTVSSLYLHSIA